MAQTQRDWVILGMGGTIAGTAAQVSDNLGYAAAQVGVAELLQGVPGLQQSAQGDTLRAEQVVQLDSKDMEPAVWWTLARRVVQHLASAEVAGVLVTHGTDTLEETAYALHRLVPAALLAVKPVVLTCAMRPASALAPDGPQNLRDALAVARTAGACGVSVVCAGVVHSALEVQKVHTYRLDAFASGDAGPLGYVEEGRLRRVRNWPLALENKVLSALLSEYDSVAWPRVEVVMNYAGAGAAVVDALLLPLPGVPALRALVVAGTGNGTLHHALQAALLRAQGAGVAVVRTSRCAQGRVLPHAGDVLPASDLPAVKARVDLMLALLLQEQAA
jgi:L-asparaginase